MVPTCCETSSQSPWVTPAGLSMEMRTKRLIPAALDLHLDHFQAFRLRHALGDFLDFGRHFVPTLPLSAKSNKKVGFRPLSGFDTQITL